MQSGQGVSAGIDSLIQRYERRAARLYRIGILLRVVIVLGSFLAVLPDSALFTFEDYAAAYGIVTSAAGLLAGFLFILARNLRIRECLDMYHDFIQYLQGQRLSVLTKDGLSRELAEIELEKEISVRRATLRKGVFDGLDRFLDSLGGGR